MMNSRRVHVGISDIRAGFASALQRHRRYRQLRSELMSMNDRELSELGISRYDIERIARETAPRERASAPTPHYSFAARRAA
jgi:uncharacterized protein YjiS (DUF1127 family)